MLQFIGTGSGTPMATIHSHRAIRFDSFEANVRTGELRRSGTKVKLPDQSFQILTMLLNNAGKLVTREDIRKKLWPNDTVVEFDHSINAAIKRLRQALGDSAEEPRFVETLPRRGYRFLPQVEFLDETTGRQEPMAEPAALLRNPAISGNFAGSKVSHYRVLELVGGGGMGLVYKAEDLKLGRRVALKFLPEDVARDPDSLERLDREARAASALDHPNICTIYEFSEHEGRPFLVMQFLEGQTLRERIADATTRHVMIPAEELLNVAFQISEGLSAAHRKGIIHRDIKPANIFLTNRGEVKILDFGIAKFMESADIEPNDRVFQQTEGGDTDLVKDGGPTPFQSLTRTGITIGTTSYMSPEQARGDRLDARTDLFSFGSVLYEMATLRQPFQGNTAALIKGAILNYAAVPIPALNPELPPELDLIIGRALEKEPEKRYQLASYMTSDLEVLKRETDSVPSAPSEVVALPLSRRAPLAFAVVFALLFVTTVILWSIRRAQPALPEVKQSQLTSNSTENPVGDGQLSSDGRYLAYVDRKGIHVKLLETGETRTIPPPIVNGTTVPMRVLKWFPDGTKLLATPSQAEPAIWTLSVTGGPARKLRDHANPTDVSPDGSSVAFTTNRGPISDSEVWLINANGGNPRKLFQADDKNTGFAYAAWSPDGRRIYYVKIQRKAPDQFKTVVESRDLQGGVPTTMYSEATGPRGQSRLWQLLWSPDGRLIYALTESAAAISSHSSRLNFWGMRIDERTGKPAEKPRRLTNWPAGFGLYDTSITADGKRLAFVRYAAEGDVYMSDLKGNGRHISTPVRLTLSEGWNHPIAWTSDSKAVIFESDRDGHFGIFKQYLGKDTAEPIVTGSDDAVLPCVSPDGNWIFYVVYHELIYPVGSSSAVAQLMRVPMTGGPPARVLQSRIYDAPRCAKSPAQLCAIAEPASDRREIIFSAFDSVTGRGPELMRLAVDPNGEYIWDLSPDGTRIALLKTLRRSDTVLFSEGPIQILSLQRRSSRELTVHGWSQFGEYLDWAPDGNGLFVSSPVPEGQVLLYVDLLGKARQLWMQKREGSSPRGVPSPDGKHLAVLGRSVNSNVWMIENF